MKKVFLFLSVISVILPLGFYYLIVWAYEIDFFKIQHILFSQGPSLEDIFPILLGASFFSGVYPLCLLVFLLAFWKQPGLRLRQKWLLTALALFLGLPCGFCIYLYLTWGLPLGVLPRKKLFLVFMVIGGLVANSLSGFFILVNNADKLLSLWKLIPSSDRGFVLMIHAFGFSASYICLIYILLFLAAWRHQKLNYNQKSLLALLTLFLGPVCGLSYYFYTAQE